jgi:hypothetical protein
MSIWFKKGLLIACWCSFFGLSESLRELLLRTLSTLLAWYTKAAKVLTTYFWLSLISSLLSYERAIINSFSISI